MAYDWNNQDIIEDRKELLPEYSTINFAGKRKKFGLERVKNKGAGSENIRNRTECRGDATRMAHLPPPGKRAWRTPPPPPATTHTQPDVYLIINDLQQYAVFCDIR